MGSLTIITGPMWSGKTTELLRQYDRKNHAGLKCLLVKHGIDNRYSQDSIVTHINTYGLHTKGTAKIYSTIDHMIQHEQLVNNPNHINTVFIDEIQFFPDKHLCVDLLNVGIHVVVAGLNGDYHRTLFPGMETLFAVASDIKMLTAVCGFCRSENACYTTRLVDNIHVGSIDVGGSDKYMASCPRCYIERKK